MIKSELRRIYLAKQKNLGPAERHAASHKIADRFFENIKLDGVKLLHSFLPIEKFGEIDTWLTIERLWNHHPEIDVCVPRVDFETNEIINLKFGSDTRLIRNVWGIDEPSHDERVRTERLDLVLVPGLCFDRHGCRVGYGKGFYDRFLSRCRPDCVKVGLSYFEPIDGIDDVYDGDVAVDVVVTPDLFCRFQS